MSRKSGKRTAGTFLPRTANFRPKDFTPWGSSLRRDSRANPKLDPLPSAASASLISAVPSSPFGVDWYAAGGGGEEIGPTPNSSGWRAYLLTLAFQDVIFRMLLKGVRPLGCFRLVAFFAQRERHIRLPPLIVLR